MKLVFMGTPDFAVPSLKKIAAEKQHEISLVVTSPDKPRKSASDAPEPTPVKEAALGLGLPVLEVDALKDESFISTLRELDADVFVIVAFRILPKEIFTIPKRGAFNLHASLLPKYRGAAPINWALMNGDTETGVTTFFLQEKVDTGNLILQKRLVIGENETYGDLTTRLAVLGADAVSETLHRITTNTVELQAQDESLVSKAPKIFKETCRIDWTKSQTDVFNFVRALSPRPTAYTTLNGKQVKIFAVKKSDASPSGEAGTVTTDGKTYLRVQTGSGAVDVLELQLEGKKRLGIEDFLRGTKLSGKFV
jgi:methionyl-tRNA formyltransferase